MYNHKMYEKGIKSSAIRELFEYGKLKKQELGEDKVFDFSIGNPNVKPPKCVNDSLIKLLENDEHIHEYTSAPGDLNVRISVAEYLNKMHQTTFSHNFIYMTTGAAAALTISFNALLNDSDEAIVFAPFFPEYKVFVESANGKLIVVNPNCKTFVPDYTDFENKITEKTKVVIINSPNNPTGVVYSEDDIKDIARILTIKAKKYNHPIYIVTDEPYRELAYDDTVVPFIPNYYDNTIVCYSFSKSLSLPGERIGYIAIGPKASYAKEIFAAVCGAGRSLGYVCAPALFQKMVIDCLGQTSDINIYKKNRDLLYNALVEYGYEVVKPKGAFYMFVKALESDAQMFSDYAKKYQLLLVPSDSFGYNGYVRISYCVSTKQIVDSLPFFKKLIEDYKKRG